MYDIDRYYREKIFVEFDTEEEFERFCDEAEVYAEDNGLQFGKNRYNKIFYYTASWINERKDFSYIDFLICDDLSYIDGLKDWYIVNAKELKVFNFDSGAVLEFIGV